MAKVRPQRNEIVTFLSDYGADPKHVRLFDGPPEPGHQDYLDLVASRKVGPDSPDGVAEAQGRPVLYFIDESRLASTHRPVEDLVNGARGRLACRGEKAYLARVQPGRVLVAPVAFEDINVTWDVYTSGSTEGRTLFSRLVNGVVDWDPAIGGGGDVFDRLRTLLFHSANRLAEVPELRPDVLSLLGRALFFRFLRDRQIVTDETVSQVAPRAKSWRDCFDGAANTAATCHWLDTTFNGDFLPLPDGGSEAYCQRIGRLSGGTVFDHLTAVILGAAPEGDLYQLTFDWGTFDFAHVPVGLLSQVYEDFCWHWDRKEASATSVHYTPRNIAVTLIDEAFHDLEAGSEARVLDPACGAGVFLVLAFRRLCRDAWLTRGKRPDRRTIRRILNRQLVGFDISENALRLAALSLYLTALELDPRPQPLSELRFENLTGRVLFNVRREGLDPSTGPVLGSLGPAVGAEHAGQYDLVMSNPPWTSAPALGAEMQSVARDVLRRAKIRGAEAYVNPDNNPDVPFLICSTEWCKVGGRIAMALPARLLLKNEPIPAAAREQLFRLIEVNGIISGVSLAKTNVWPGTDLPFILLFARNVKPVEEGTPVVTHLVCPHYEERLNRQGEFRLDADSCKSVVAKEAETERWLWKAWLIGTLLDVDIIRRIQQRSPAITIAHYWERHHLASGTGYKVAAEGAQRDATSLIGKPNVSARVSRGFLLDTSSLPLFTRKTLYRTGPDGIYTAPIVLVRRSPGTDRSKGFAYLTLRNAVYVSSYTRYSTSGHTESTELARYLHLLVHSSIWLHFGLMTSAQFGAERNILEKQSIDDFPFIPFESLSPEQRMSVSVLSERLISGDEGVFSDIDALFGGLYGLTDMDLEVISDTLDVGQGYRAASGDRACAPPTLAECVRFVERLRNLLAPLLEVPADKVPVRLWFPNQQPTAADTFGAILLGSPDAPVDPDLYFNQVLPLADSTGASQVLMVLNKSGLLVGLRNQYRYWTGTRARLLAATIVGEHLDSIADPAG